MMRSCAEIERFIDLYLDAEFGDEDRAKFEAHLESCSPCRSKVETQADWRRRIVAAARSAKPTAPPALRNLVLAKLDEAERQQRASSRRRFAGVIAALPVAAAAAYALVVMQPAPTPTLTMPSTSPVVADVAKKHARNLPFEVKSQKDDELRNWYADKVSFPVRPPKFRNVSASLRGGRLANVRERDAAYLVYDINGNKVSVFMFDPREMQQQGGLSQQPTFSEDNGHQVALFEDSGVGYAIASDMDRESMVKLISAVAH